MQIGKGGHTGATWNNGLFHRGKVDLQWHQGKSFSNKSYLLRSMTLNQLYFTCPGIFNQLWWRLAKRFNIRKTSERLVDCVEQMQSLCFRRVESWRQSRSKSMCFSYGYVLLYMIIWLNWDLVKYATPKYIYNKC